MSNRNGLNELAEQAKYIIGNRGKSLFAYVHIERLAGALVPTHMNAVNAANTSPMPSRSPFTDDKFE